MFSLSKSCYWYTSSVMQYYLDIKHNREIDKMLHPPLRERWPQNQ